MKAIEVICRAKINPYLRVTSGRDDGYHEIETIFQSVSLADDLTAMPANEVDVSITWAAGLDGLLPVGPDLAEQALYAAGVNARVSVVKRIPVAGGLGGGSADAAGALLAASRIREEPIDEDALLDYAKALGADVPFALTGGTAVGAGRGDELTPIPTAAPLWWVLGVVARGIVTGEVYSRFEEVGPGDDAPDIADAIVAFDGADVDRIADCLHNDLEKAACEFDRSLPGRLESMVGAGAIAALLSGSGPTVAGLCRSEKHARGVAQRAATFFERTEVVQSTAVGAEVVS